LPVEVLAANGEPSLNCLSQQREQPQDIPTLITLGSGVEMSAEPNST